MDTDAELPLIAAGDADAFARWLADAERPPRPPDPMLREAIRACREQLPGKPQQALDARLASGGGAGDPDLAASLGMRLNTFLQNVTRARQLLAECLRRRGVHLDVELGA